LRVTLTNSHGDSSDGSGQRQDHGNHQGQIRQPLDQLPRPLAGCGHGLVLSPIDKTREAFAYSLKAEVDFTAATCDGLSRELPLLNAITSLSSSW